MAKGPRHTSTVSSADRRLFEEARIQYGSEPARQLKNGRHKDVAAPAYFTPEIVTSSGVSCPPPGEIVLVCGLRQWSM